jgi:uncharacterized membrane protein (UPF0127 family)
MTRSLRRTLVLCALALPWLAGAQAPQKLPSVRLNAGIHNIQAEVAQTPEQRAIGLMHRREMAAQDGMLFVFEQPGVQCFWMKNTLIPLAIAFVGDDGKVVNIEEMQPMSERSHCSARPVRFALEMNQGWFAKRSIRSGDSISGPPFRPTGR